jgi:hypothetical protein
MSEKLRNQNQIITKKPEMVPIPKSSPVDGEPTIGNGIIGPASYLFDQTTTTTNNMNNVTAWNNHNSLCLSFCIIVNVIVRLFVLFHNNYNQNNNAEQTNHSGNDNEWPNWKTRFLLYWWIGLCVSNSLQN